MGGAAAYLLRYHAHRAERSGSALTRNRPWRPAGAFLVAAVSVLFYVGLNHVDPKQEPEWFLALWAVVVLLLGVLMVLALVDMRHTRKVVRKLLDRGQRGD